MGFQLTIGGEAHPGDGRFEVINPATEEVVAQCPAASAETLDRAVEAARKAQSDWGRDEQRRREALLAAADSLLAAADEIARTLTSEQGKPVREARYEVKMMSRWFKYYADLETGPETVAGSGARIEILRRPIGVVGAITPWNFPLALTSWKLAPAFLAGNTVVLKPSPLTPLSTLQVGEILAQVLPSGVLNVVAGPEPLGSQMSSHAGIDKISFTGSIATGKAVAASGAPLLRRDTLELGGNDAAIVLEDADLGQVASGALASAFVNCGQVCSAIKRLYVPRRLLAEVSERIVSGAEAIRVGDGFDRDTRMGPMISAEQRQFMDVLIKDARERGATLLTGGDKLPGPGFFFQPTVLSIEDRQARVVAEEQFGPVLPLIPYDDVESAVEMANDTEFGLGGSVWASDEARAREVAGRLECGTVWINHHVTVHPEQPFGGWKQSGVGVENGRQGLEEFTRLQTVFTPERD